MPKFLSQFFVKIGGADVSKEFMDDVIEIVVESTLYLPEMVTIQLHDPDLKWVDDTSLELGKEIEISATASEELESAQGTLIKAEITALEPEFTAQGQTTMLVRGYSKAHRLHRGKKSRTFLQKKDSDLASTLAGEAGLSVEADATTVTYDYILQNNQTNMEFLQSRAARIGYQVFTAEGKLYFKKGEANLGDGPELKLGADLRSFRPALAATHQADTIKVYGWDPKLKQVITAQATPNAAMNQGGIGKTGGAAAQSAYSAATTIITNRPVFTQAEATELAKGLANDLSGEFIEAEGISYGDPGIKAGKRITIKGVGTRFSGKYFVTAASHIWNADGYETHFTISGRQPNTISHLVQSENGHEEGLGLINGVVIGQVTNLNDPDDLGRVKVKYPWLGSSPEIESWWVRIATPMAGSSRGFMYLPEINDEVLIAFEHGDVHRPYIVGALWSSTDKPPKKNSEATASGKVNQRVIKTRSGHLIILDDKQGEEQISITSKSGHNVILNDKSGSESITVADKTGNNKMVIDSTKNSMTINVNGDFTVDAKGKVTINSMQDMTVDTKGKATIKSALDMTMESTINLTAKGGVGVTVQNNAGAKVALTGPMVNIN